MMGMASKCLDRDFVAARKAGKADRSLSLAQSHVPFRQCPQREQQREQQANANISPGCAKHTAAAACCVFASIRRGTARVGRTPARAGGAGSRRRTSDAGAATGFRAAAAAECAACAGCTAGVW